MISVKTNLQSAQNVRSGMLKPAYSVNDVCTHCIHSIQVLLMYKVITAPLEYCVYIYLYANMD